MIALRDWWSRHSVIALAMLLSTIPMWFAAVPPLIDFIGHMGHYQVQLHLADSPDLQRNWAFQWRWVGNLGVDLLMEPLGRLFGVERGAWIIAAALPPLMIWGQIRLSHAAHGTAQSTVFAAFPFALSYPWQYGLVNFWLGVALALHAAAWWLGRASTRWGAVLLALLSIGLWTAHIYGWVVFAIIVWSCAVAHDPRRFMRTTWTLAPLAAPLFVMFATGYANGDASGGVTLGWFSWTRKFAAFGDTLRDQWRPLDLGSLILACVLISAGWWSRAVTFHRGLALAAAIILLAITLLPYQLIGSAYADARLWPVFFMIAILALQSSSVTIAIVAALIFVVRMGFGAHGFAGYDRDYTRHLRALDKIDPGSRIAVMTEFPCKVSWRRPRLDHLDGMAIVRRNAFTNGQWDVPGAQLLTPLAAAGTPVNADPSQLVRARGCPADLRPELARRLAAFPRDRFDYVWAIGFMPETLPAYPGLSPLYADDRTILYRIVK